MPLKVLFDRLCLPPQLARRCCAWGLTTPLLLCLQRSSGSAAVQEALKEGGVSRVGHRCKIIVALDAMLEGSLDCSLDSLGAAPEVGEGRVAIGGDAAGRGEVKAGEESGGGEAAGAPAMAQMTNRPEAVAPSADAAAAAAVPAASAASAFAAALAAASAAAAEAGQAAGAAATESHAKGIRPVEGRGGREGARLSSRANSGANAGGFALGFEQSPDEIFTMC